MDRIIRNVTGEYADKALELVERVFTEHENAREGAMVRRLVEEIRAGRYYVAELELIMLNGQDEIIGYCMFSRFHLEGRYENELLLMTPVAVRTDMQRQHVSKELIEYGLERARKLGYKAAIVEGNPRNYNPRGFTTAADYGIVPGENLHLPHIDCLMARELIPGGLEHMHGKVDYGYYRSLSE